MSNDVNLPIKKITTVESTTKKIIRLILEAYNRFASYNKWFIQFSRLRVTFLPSLVLANEW